MDKVDQFASRFKSAAKVRYRHETLGLTKVLVVTDLDESAARAFGDGVAAFLSGRAEPMAVETLDASAFQGIGDLLAVLQGKKPDVVCTYRHLLDRAERWPTTLGSAVEVLTQETRFPVLLLPHPDAEPAKTLAGKRPRHVMVVTDHLTGEGRLVNHGLAFALEGGTLTLTHVEDDLVFSRYLEIISKIPEIDTELARSTIDAQLMKEPRDYIQSCRETLAAVKAPVTVEEVVIRGHLLSTYRRLVEERGVDLLVMRTKDEDQLAMHGLAYPLAVELRAIPLLML